MLVVVGLLLLSVVLLWMDRRPAHRRRLVLGMFETLVLVATVLTLAFLLWLDQH
jgi:hypothetical protein